jgi:hypothetical protein
MRTFRFYVPTGIAPSYKYPNVDPYSIWETRLINPDSNVHTDSVVFIKLTSSDSKEASEAARYLSRGKGGGQTYGGAGEASPDGRPSGNIAGTKGQGGYGTITSGDPGPGGGGGWYGGGAVTLAGGSGGGSSYYQILKYPRADRGVQFGNGYAKITILSPSEKYS